MKKHIFFFVLTLPLLFASCETAFYEKIDTLPNDTWNVDSLLSYEVDIDDSLQYYNIYVNVRNTVDFETQNFYVFMTTEFPDGFTAIDTLGCILCDVHGKWTGKGTGRLRDNKFLLKSKVRFAQKGRYRFVVRQAMRNDNVKGIANFGLSLYPYKERD